jgi:hypothetical protein
MKECERDVETYAEDHGPLEASLLLYATKTSDGFSVDSKKNGKACKDGETS